MNSEQETQKKQEKIDLGFDLDALPISDSIVSTGPDGLSPIKGIVSKHEFEQLNEIEAEENTLVEEDLETQEEKEDQQGNGKITQWIKWVKESELLSEREFIILQETKDRIINDNAEVKFKKIFIIGCNKTATTTIHDILRRNMKSQHVSSGWDIDSYNAVSDNGNLMPWIYYDKISTNSLFVLNVRPLKDWLFSRSFHHNGKNRETGNPPFVELFKEWIITRNVHHFNVLNYFYERNNLKIVDISKENWTGYFCETIGIAHTSKHIGKSSYDNKDVELAENAISQAFQDFEIPTKEMYNPMVIECLLDDESQKKYKIIQKGLEKISN